MVEIAEGRDQLIADANEWLQNITPWPPALLVLRLRDALDAPVAVDETELAEVLMGHEFNALGKCTCGHSTPDFGSGNRRRVYEKRHFSGVIAEWLRGERA